MQQDSSFIELQRTVAGRFSLDREIGRGGMGIVFLARDVHLDRAVAIKLLAPDHSRRPGMRARFLSEARMAAQCFHPNIVPIHSVEEHGDIAFIVMAYVPGETLAERIARSGALAPEAVLQIGREMGWALAYAHGRGVIHRDVKPENILIEQGTDRALLTDFGIAAFAGDTGSNGSGRITGTMAYMAPEQAAGVPVDGRADLYALGKTLFVAATGIHPDSAATMSRSLTSLMPLLPPPAADVIDQCLAPVAADRPESAVAFIQALGIPQAVTPVSRAALTVQAAARGMESTLGWSLAVAAATALVGTGEAGLGRAMTFAIGSAVAAIIAATAVLKGVEALLETRRALRRGSTHDDLVRALSGVERHQTGGRPRWRGAATAIGGLGLALATGTLTATFNHHLPMVSDFLQIGLLSLSPFLIVRGTRDLLNASPVSSWIRQKLLTPASRLIVRMSGGGRQVSRPPVDTALTTELYLDKSLRKLFNSLPPQVRSNLGDIPAAISSLAQDVESLRAADAALAEAERAERAAGSAGNAQEIAELAARRTVMHERISTSVSLLETIRLDLMRIAALNERSVSITGQLESVRAIRHRLEAEEEVRQLLRNPFTAGAIT